MTGQGKNVPENTHSLPPKDNLEFAKLSTGVFLEMCEETRELDL